MAIGRRRYNCSHHPSMSCLAHRFVNVQARLFSHRLPFIVVPRLFFNPISSLNSGSINSTPLFSPLLYRRSPLLLSYFSSTISSRRHDLRTMSVDDIFKLVDGDSLGPRELVVAFNLLSKKKIKRLKKHILNFTFLS